MLDARSNTPGLVLLGLRKMRNRLSFLKPFFILFTALVFIVNSVGGDLLLGKSWAAESIAGLTSVGPENAGGPAPLKELSAGTFTIPQELGYIQEAVNMPNSSKTVIHIQDAHCNYAAQKSIAGILDYLTKEYGVNAVNCEGGSEGYDLSVFTDIPEKDIREKTSDYFVKEGVVSAAEFFAVNNPQNVDLWGVEDAGLYMKNLKVYRESLTYKSEAGRYIKSIAYILDNLKRHIYSPQLLDFDNNYMKYKDGKIGFKDYIKCLIAAAGESMINIKSFPNIYLLNQTLEEEDKINFKRANNEKDEVVDKLKKVLSKNEIEELLAKVGQMKIERISQADFYAYLARKAKSIKLELKNYPELEKYIIYISIYSAIDRTKVAKEMDALEDKIQESLYENDTQRELGILSKNIILEKNMFNISFTREDYAYYQEHRASFSVENFTRFIDAKAPLYKIQAKLDSGIGRLDVYREKMEAFYECSLERDKAFVKNIKFTDHARPNSIIITGGFHAQNLRELFGKENVSYISVMPKFTNPAGYESPYLSRLAGQRTALENVIDTAIPAVLNLQVVNFLNTVLAVRVEGPANLAKFRLAVAIISMIMRGQDFTLIIDKKVPIKGMEDGEDKVITFTEAELAKGVSPTIKYARDAGADVIARANAILTEVSRDAFIFNLISPQGQVKAEEAMPVTPTVQAPSATIGGIPVVGPFAEIVGGQPRLILPAEQATAVAKPIGQPIYEAAVEPAVGVASSLKDTATRIISLVASDGDEALVGRFGQIARNLVGPDIHLSSYVDNADKGVWMPKLRELLEIELKNFVENDLLKRAPLMEIRIREGKDTREDVEQMIGDVLTKLGYQERMKDIRDRIKLVQVQIEQGKQTNPAIEFFADMGMLECARYVNGDYGDEKTPPEDLKNSFIALLKLSIKNGTDFDDKNIDEILGMIFAGHLLEIKPADFKSFDEWHKANRQLMQSV
ncbi:MAG: hypothetical protein Q8R38_03615 [Candidatus Omnitrophota bacterium]|nr:hypothetical protein [Candidatus Omnitrophota bacterium]